MTKLVCAWCGTSIDRPGYSPSLDGHTSHGMCAACSQALTAQDNGLSLQRHIDTIPIPILVVDHQNTVVAANGRACEVLGRKLEVGPLQPSFELIFDCVHAHLPEGCGRAIHCSGCAIRKNVAATFRTGEAQISVPATLTVSNSDQPSEVVFSITTLKRDEVVVMRIDPVMPERSCGYGG